MVRVRLDIDDPVNGLTLKAMLEAEGHVVAGETPDVVIVADVDRAVRHAKECPTLVLAKASDISGAVAAMLSGVYGYVFVPFQPGEAGLMVARAARADGAPVESEPPLMTLEESEAHLIRATLRRCKGNRSKAARILGIGRNTLWRKLKKIEARDPKSKI